LEENTEWFDHPEDGVSRIIGKAGSYVRVVVTEGSIINNH